MRSTRTKAKTHDGTKRHVEAGTIGRLIRVCMQVARADPKWRAYGPVKNITTPAGKHVVRQEMRTE